MAFTTVGEWYHNWHWPQDSFKRLAVCEWYCPYLLPLVDYLQLINSKWVRLSTFSMRLSHEYIESKSQWCSFCEELESNDPWQAVSVTITVRTPCIMQSWLVGQALLFSFYLLNLATPLLSYAVCLVLLLFVLLMLLPCYFYNAVFILTLGYHLFTNTYVS